MKSKMKMFAVTLFGATLLAACNGESAIEENTSKIIETDIKEMVHDYSVRNMTAKSVSITSQQLYVSDQDGKDTVYDLPEDEFFVSIAPYINETHPCDNHNLTGCQGELINKDFKVYIEDTEGKVVVDDTLTSQVNGFFDLWLPRDEKYLIKIEHEGKKVESEFSTFENDGTCITTMQLI